MLPSWTGPKNPQMVPRLYFLTHRMRPGSCWRRNKNPRNVARPYFLTHRMRPGSCYLKKLKKLKYSKTLIVFQDSKNPGASGASKNRVGPHCAGSCCAASKNPDASGASKNTVWAPSAGSWAPSTMRAGAPSSSLRAQNARGAVQGRATGPPPFPTCHVAHVRLCKATEPGRQFLTGRALRGRKSEVRRRVPWE